MAGEQFSAFYSLLFKNIIKYSFPNLGRHIKKAFTMPRKQILIIDLDAIPKAARYRIM